MTTSPAPGQIAPPFALPRDGGRTVSLADHAGRKLVIFVYPEDNSPSCTTEAKSFSDLLPDFAACGTAVYGLSQDPLPKHDKFIAKHGLQVPLLSDPAHAFIGAYGLWVEKQMYGKTYMGVERATFLIGADGRLAQVWHTVRVKDHAAQVLAAAQSLG